MMYVTGGGTRQASVDMPAAAPGRARQEWATLMLCAACLLFASRAHATITFERAWAFLGGNNWTHTVAETPDGGYVAEVNLHDSAHNVTAGLLKTDSLGNETWHRRYVPVGDSVAVSEAATVTRDRGYVVAGSTNGPGISDGWMVKADSTGDTVWTFTYSGPGYDLLRGVAATSDSGCIATGEITTAADWGLGLLKLSKDGETAWSRVYHPVGMTAFGRTVSQLPDGGFVAYGGATPDSGDPTCMYLMRTDPEGEPLWTVVDTTPMGACGWVGTASVTATGNVAVCGVSVSEDSFAGYLMLYDTLGNKLWERLMLPSHFFGPWAFVRCVTAVPDGGFAIVGEGSCNRIDSAPHIILLRLDSRGDTLWHREFDGLERNRHDTGWWVTSTSDGGFAIAGTADERYVYLVKTDSLGLVYNSISENPQPAAALRQLEVLPNPFNNTTRISYTVPVEGRVRVDVFDISGRAVATLVDADQPAGRTSTNWNARNLASGVYLVKVTLPGGSTTEKLMLLR